VPAGAVLERPKPVILTRTEVEPQLGGEGSGFPPRYLIATGAHGHSIIGIDLGAHWTSVATVVSDRPKLVVGPVSSCLQKNSNNPPEGWWLEPISSDSLVALIGTDADLNEGLQISTHFSNRELQDRFIQQLMHQSQVNAENLIKKCVIAIPASLNAEKRRLLKELVEESGLEVLSLINEHTAATLAHVHNAGSPDGCLLVISMGATHSAVSIIEVRNGILETRATSVDGNLGTEDFDGALIDWICQQFEYQHKISLARTTENLIKLRSVAIHAQRDLAMGHMAFMSVGGLKSNQSLLDFNQYHVSLKIDQSQCTRISQSLLDRQAQLIQNVLKESKMCLPDLKGILFAGRQAIDICDVLRRMSYPVRLPPCAYAESGATAFGAALQASILTRNMKNYVVWDTLAIPLWVELPDGTCKQIISESTPLPITAYHRIESTDATVNLHVLQGHSPVANENVSIAEVTVNNCPPTASAGTKIEIAVMARADGTVEFSARHVELQVNLPVTVLRGRATAFSAKFFMPELPRARVADPNRIARLCRKLNMSREEVLVALRSIGYSPQEIESGIAVEMLISKLAKKKKKKGKS
jgi:molecular chaperone DnaK (HSP70)